MKQMKTRRAFWLLLIILQLILLPVEEGWGASKEMDLARTLNFVESWASRQAFPESTPFAFYSAYCLLALGGELNDGFKKKIVDYVGSCQREDGGFASDPSALGSNVIFTYYALEALNLLDSISLVKREKVIRFVDSLVLKEGGIKGKQEDKEANLVTTYYGIRSLDLLGALNNIDHAKSIVFIKSYRQMKGFGMMSGKPAAPQATFMAVKALEILGGLDEETQSNVIKYLQRTRYAGLFGHQKYATLPNVEDMTYVVETASILSVLDRLNVDRIYEFLQQLYVADNGGFGPSPGLGTTPPSTYFAVVCLVKLGKLRNSGLTCSYSSVSNGGRCLLFRKGAL